MEIYEDTLSFENLQISNQTADSIDSIDNTVNPYKRITRRIDSIKIRNNQRHDIEVNVSLTKELKITRETPVRSGSIIYTKDKVGSIYFCLGVDTQSGNLTDFGGGVKKGETIVDGGLRELEEESLGIFGHIDSTEVEETVTFHSSNMAIIFIPLQVNRNEITKQFNEKIQGKINPEVCDIVWLDMKEFMESIHGRGRKLYIRVRKLLSKVTSTITEL